MSECVSCGSMDFHFLNGGYFCTTCHTLSQDHGLTTQQDDDAVYDGYTHGAKINLRKQQNESGRKVNSSINFGRPWRSHEALQYVLKEQVHDLINIGIDPGIRNVVFRLWVKFLQKYGLAFLNEPPNPEKVALMKAHERSRDKYPGTLKDPFRILNHRNISISQSNDSQPVDCNTVGSRQNICQGSLIRKRRHLEHFKIRKVPSARSRDTLDASVALAPYFESKFYVKLAFQCHVEDDKGLWEDESEDTFDTPEAVLNLLMDAHKQDTDLLKRLKGNQIVYDDEGVPVTSKGKHTSEIDFDNWYKGCLSVTCLLGLINAALQYVNNRVLPHDLVRWIKECKLQYNRTEFPEDMKFFNNDHLAFHEPHMPTPGKIVEETANIVRFLELTNFPEVDITSIAHRFIIELGLPGELHTMVANLIQMKQPSFSLQNFMFESSTANVDFACLALSYIVIVLKMVFRLDDVTEWKFSDYAQTLTSFIDFVQPLFIWRDWVSYMEQQMAAEHAQCFPKTLRGARNIEDADSVFNLYDLQNSRFNQYNNTTFYSKAKTSTRKSIAEYLNDLHKKSCEEVGYEQNNEQLEQEIDDFGDYEYSKTSLSRKKILFQNSTLQFILDPQTFLDNLGKNHDENDPSVSRIRDFDKDVDSDSEFNPSLDMFASEHHRRTETLETPNLCNRLKKPGTTLIEILQSLPFQPSSFPKPYENYILFEIPEMGRINKHEPYMKDYPAKVVTRCESYRWLIKACSSHIYENSAVLDRHVQKLELVLFSKLKILSNREEVLRSIFVQNYFPRIKLSN